MTALNLNTFGGEVPRVSDRLLPGNKASTATNCKLLNGELSGINEPEVVKDFPNFSGTLKSAFRIPGNEVANVWLGFASTDVDLVRGPLVNDAYSRYYWTEPNKNISYNTLGRMEGELAAYELGIQGPGLAPSVVVTGGSGDTETRAYVYTFVTDFGEESQPSPPATVTGYVNATSWDLSNILTTIPNHTSRAPASTVRIYRTITGQSSASYYKVADVALGTSTYSDSEASLDVVRNPLLKSTLWAPPVSKIQGLVSLPGGYLAAFKGRDIYFSEAYRPHAWPVEYTVTVQHAVVGLAVFNNALVILTESEPYIAFGSSPASMSLIKSDVIEPCLSKASISTFEMGVMYCSPNGIILVNATTASGFVNITKKLVERNDWQQNFNPSLVKAAHRGFEYIAFEDTSNGFKFSPDESLGTLVNLDRFLGVENVQTDPLNGDLYLIRRNRVYKWDPANTDQKTYTWTSKIFVVPRPLNMGAFRFKMVTDPISQGSVSLAVDTAFNNARIAFPLSPINSAPVNGVKVKTISGYYGDQNKTPVGGSPLFQLTELGAPGVIFSVYADGVRKYIKTIEDELTHKLPSGFKASTWQFTLTSNTTIYSLEVAETGKELMSV